MSDGRTLPRLHSRLVESRESKNEAGASHTGDRSIGVYVQCSGLEEYTYT